MNTPPGPPSMTVPGNTLAGLAMGDPELFAEGLEMRAAWQAGSGLDPRSGLNASPRRPPAPCRGSRARVPAVSPAEGGVPAGHGRVTLREVLEERGRGIGRAGSAG